MSVTFAPAIPSSTWATQPDQLICLATDEILMSFLPEWRETITTREQFEKLASWHCEDCQIYAATVQRKAPEGYAELNVNNHNASRLLLQLGLAQSYEEGESTYVELSGTISLSVLEEALLVAAWANNPVHRVVDLQAVVKSCYDLGITEVQYC